MKEQGEEKIKQEDCSEDSLGSGHFLHLQPKDWHLINQGGE